uniref:Uncharacterized protein n=1 Tax=Arundo donax TaxID=35708 RepID=A0A0A8YCC3_ARUDO
MLRSLLWSVCFSSRLLQAGLLLQAEINRLVYWVGLLQFGLQIVIIP